MLATNKQNEKQRKIIKVHENVKISRKKFEEQTKGTPPRKMFAQIWQHRLMMIDLIKKEGFRQKEKGPTKRFSYGLMSRKPQDQEIEKFLPHPISGGMCKTSGRKGGWQRFVALRQKGSGWGLCLNVSWREQTGLTSKSSMISSLWGKPDWPTNENCAFF